MARLWADGDGPSHDAISAAIQSVGLSPETFVGAKAARVRAALSSADDQQAIDLASELVDLLRDGRFLSSDYYASRVSKLGAALEGVGATLTPDGRIAWGTDGPASEREHPSGSTATPRISLGSDYASPTTAKDPPMVNPTIFLVHGHDEALRDKIEAQLRRWISPVEIVILDQQASRGQVLVEKFEHHARTAALAIVLATPDDEGRAVGAPELRPRARQNVIFELGYFFGKLGRDRVVVMDAGIEKPSDVGGIVYLDLNMSDWRQRLARELKAAGIDGDWLR
jgi:hypothetical protein